MTYRWCGEVLTHPMLNQLAQLGLSGMAQASPNSKLPARRDAHPCRLLGLLIDREMTHRRDKRLAGPRRYAQSISCIAMRALSGCLCRGCRFPATSASGVPMDAQTS